MKKVIRKEDNFKCYKCSGTGFLDSICNEQYACDACPIKPCINECSVCNGTGIYKESYYYFIDPKNKIAFSKDTL